MYEMFTEAEIKALDPILMAVGSNDQQASYNATLKIAKALETPLRKGVLSGDILGNIFQVIPLRENSTSEFPLDFLRPGSEGDYVAYTIPNHGYIPQKNIEGDYVVVPTYSIGNAIDWLLKYARDARWDVVGQALRVYREGYTKKMNDDGWHVILGAAFDRNIVVADSDAGVGQFTKRLVSLGKLVMRRNGGGNSTSLNRGKMTDMAVSPEGMEDIRNWNVDQVDEVTRRQIFLSEDDNALNRIFGVNLRDIDEFGEGQEYQNFFEDELGATLPAGDVEIAIGLDLANRDSFIMPVRELPSVYPDRELHRQRRAGVYGWAELGFAALDNRRVVALSF
jgi:hypothetical protein